MNVIRLLYGRHRLSFSYLICHSSIANQQTMSFLKLRCLIIGDTTKTKPRELNGQGKAMKAWPNMGNVDILGRLKKCLRVLTLSKNMFFLALDKPTCNSNFSFVPYIWH